MSTLSPPKPDPESPCSANKFPRSPESTGSKRGTSCGTPPPHPTTYHGNSNSNSNSNDKHPRAAVKAAVGSSSVGGGGASTVALISNLDADDVTQAVFPPSSATPAGGFAPGMEACEHKARSCHTVMRSVREVIRSLEDEQHFELTKLEALKESNVELVRLCELANTLLGALMSATDDDQPTDADADDAHEPSVTSEGAYPTAVTTSTASTSAALWSTEGGGKEIAAIVTAVAPPAAVSSLVQSPSLAMQCAVREVSQKYEEMYCSNCSSFEIQHGRLRASSNISAISGDSYNSSDHGGDNRRAGKGRFPFVPHIVTKFAGYEGSADKASPASQSQSQAQSQQQSRLDTQSLARRRSIAGTTTSHYQTSALTQVQVKPSMGSRMSKMLNPLTYLGSRTPSPVPVGSPSLATAAGNVTGGSHGMVHIQGGGKLTIPRPVSAGSSRGLCHSKSAGPMLGLGSGLCSPGSDDSDEMETSSTTSVGIGASLDRHSVSAIKRLGPREKDRGSPLTTSSVSSDVSISSPMSPMKGVNRESTAPVSAAAFTSVVDPITMATLVVQPAALEDAAGTKVGVIMELPKELLVDRHISFIDNAALVSLASATGTLSSGAVSITDASTTLTGTQEGGASDHCSISIGGSSLMETPALPALSVAPTYTTGTNATISVIKVSIVNVITNNEVYRTYGV